MCENAHYIFYYYAETVPIYHTIVLVYDKKAIFTTTTQRQKTVPQSGSWIGPVNCVSRGFMSLAAVGRQIAAICRCDRGLTVHKVLRSCGSTSLVFLGMTPEILARLRPHVTVSLTPSGIRQSISPSQEGLPHHAMASSPFVIPGLVPGANRGGVTPPVPGTSPGMTKRGISRRSRGYRSVTRFLRRLIGQALVNQPDSA
jgi:hypothetical protein